MILRRLHKIRFSLIKSRCYATKHNSSSAIRQQFLDFFIKENNHAFVRSSSVVPFCDPTLSFTNAGMNQFKNILLGQQEPKYKRVANSQKCIRVGGKHCDISVVGKDSYHHTFFEMLGNWSFGDYFKKEACEMAWRLLTEVYKIPPERLYVTYFKGDADLGLERDKECRNIWLSLGVPQNRIIGFGAKENFWEMGKSGPCGRCTEIHIDHLPTYKNTNRARDVNQDKSDLTELWNLVFIENYRKPNGEIIELKEKHIDTGMGFERLVAFLQGKSSNYDTDLFTPIFEKIEKTTQKPPYTGMFSGENVKRDTSYRILADHSRMVAICLADGMIPEQNHKFRRILRKCIITSEKHFRHSNLLMSTIPVVADILGDTYPELHRKLFSSLDIVKFEEEYFKILRDTMSKGIREIINQNPRLIDVDMYECPGFLQAYTEFNRYRKQNRGVISGDMAFELYSTYGLPLEVIEKLAEVEGMNVDIDAFEEIMQEMKNNIASMHLTENLVAKIDAIAVPSTDNEPKYSYSYDSSDKLYRTERVKSKVLCILDENGAMEDTTQATSKQIQIIVEKSPFYCESGGQESDTGSIIVNDKRYQLKNIVLRKNYLLHEIECPSSSLKVGDTVELEVDDVKRTACTRNHSATHILNAVVRQVTKLPTYQKSSAVNSDELRIELAVIGAKLSESDLVKIEERIRMLIKEKPLESKIKVINSLELQNENDIVMVPGEIYPDENIRLVTFGDTSKELCCGTHIFNSYELEEFVLLNVRSTGRTSYLFIATTGESAINVLQKGEQLLQELTSLNENVSPDNFAEVLPNVRKISTLLANEKISYLKKLQSLNMIHSIKEKVKHESRNILSELMDIEMKSVVEKAADSSYILHFLACSDLMKNVSIQKATRYAKDKPVLIISYTDDEVKARCCVPKDLISNEFNAKSWLSVVGSVFLSKVEAPKGQDPLEVCIMKGRKWNPTEFNRLLEEALVKAKLFIESGNVRKAKLNG